jgi:cytochrome b6-f complex iron-sulfur subunit
VESDLSRRQLVVAAGAGTGALVLAACSGGSSGSSSGSGASSGAGGSAPGAGSSSGAGGSASGGSAAAGGAVVATLADIPVGSAIAAQDPSSGKPIVVAQPAAGKAVAFSAICTHMGCTVAPAGAELHCPCHGSRYNALTGAVLQGPAPRSLPSVPVHVAGGKVVEGSA